MKKENRNCYQMTRRHKKGISKKYQYDEIIIDRIIEMRTDGHGLLDIQKVVGIGTSTLYKICKKHGLTGRYNNCEIYSVFMQKKKKWDYL